MPIDLSKEREDEGLIPEGLYKLKAELMPGNYGDEYLLRQTKSGNLAYLKIKNTVIGGPYDGTWIYNMLIVEQVPDATTDPEQLAKDKKTVSWHRSIAKRMVASARAVDIEKTDDETLSKLLTINSWEDLEGLVYWAQVGIKPAQNGFRAANKIDDVITPADTKWPGSPGHPKLPTRPIVQPKSDDPFNDEIPPF